MRKEYFFFFVVAATLLLSSISSQPVMAQASGGQKTTASSGACNRECLNGLVDKYLDAVVAHDPSLLPLAKPVKFTENGQRLELGDGFWKTASTRGTYKLYVDDLEGGQVGFMGTMREAGQPVIVALRLKIERGRIAEIETIVARGAMSERGAANLEKLGAPDPIYTEEVPPAERVSRAELVKTANKYFSGMQLNDGKGDYSFFADDCNRLENGMQTTNNPNPMQGVSGTSNTPPPPVSRRYDPALKPTMYSSAWPCKDQFQSGLLHFVTHIRDRRYVVVDREHGLSFGFVFFDHAAGNTRTFQTPGGLTVTAGPQTPWTWEICEMFKVQGGKIHRIEAVLNQVPYGMGSGWSTWEQSMSDQARW
jgi:hypothetical protein